jgi:3-deoxy-D-manno-octulosonate 8-phosphate phosphatase (KDO 8-P phosphatase)
MTLPETDSLAALLSTIRLVVFDFDGVMTDNGVYVTEDGRESVRCDRSDGLGLQRLAATGIATLILSTEVNPVVSARAAKLKIPCLQGQNDKLAALTAFAGARQIPLDQVAYVGNDVNDAGCLNAVGLPMVVADAWPEVMPLARYCTSRPGGRGAVREICELFVKTSGGVHAG